MQHQWIPAKVGDIIKKVGSHYYSELQDGEHFVVLDVFSGDDTAVVLGKDGKLKTLCFPEEYEVVGTVEELMNTESTSRPKGNIIYGNLTGSEKEHEFWNKLKRKSNER